VRRKFRFSLNEEVEILEYKDNSDVHPRFRRLCRGCDSYSRDKSFKDGWHNLTFRATLNPIVEANVSFFVDSKDPLIRGTSPTRGFIDSKIDVEFQELNPDKLLLTYGNESDLVIIEINISEDCVLDRNYECTTSLNLSYFNGGEIFYWFNLTDVAGNYDISRERDVTVDTIAPEINSFNLTVLGRKAEFVFNITELNFEEVNYIDYEDRRPRERRLCNRLKEGICEKTKTFRSGDHNLTINVLDEAGNFDVIDGVLFSV
jgi:hypothetical protein